MTSKRKNGRSTQRPREVLPPAWLRPKMSTAKVWAVTINMQTNVVELTKGTADDSILWDFIGGVLTWKKVAETLGYQEAYALLEGIYIEVASSLSAGWIVSGVAQLSEEHSRRCFDALPWCEALAETVDMITATASASWSQQVLDALHASYKKERLERIDRELKKINEIQAKRRASSQDIVAQAA